MNREGTTKMIPLQNYNRVVLAAVENRVLIDVTVIDLAGVHDAVAVQTHVVAAPTAVVDAACVSVHFVVIVVIVGVAVTKTWVNYYSCMLAMNYDDEDLSVIVSKDGYVT